MGSFSPFTPKSGSAYAGWVPTITGQLSFSLIGLGGAAPGCVTANVEFQDKDAGHPRRRVAVIKRRVTRDLPATFFPIPEIFRSIAAEFVLLGETRPAARPAVRNGAISPRNDEIGVLTGSILVIPSHKELRTAEKALVSRIRRRIAAIGDSTPRAVVGADASLRVELDEWIAEASRTGLRLARAHFELYRTGEFRLEMVDSLPVAGSETDDQAEFDTILASQIYYFVKDIAHRHYHHRPASDNLLPLTRITADNDLDWRRETMWSLARAVLEMRRSGKLPGHKSALGVLAYAEAFQGLLARVHRPATSVGSFELTDEIACYDFTHTRQSLDATIAEKSFIHSHWNGIQTFLVGTGLAFAALWLAVAQVRDLGCRSRTDCPQIPEPMTELVRWALEQPHIMAAVLVILGAIYLEASRRSLMVVAPLRVWGDFVGEWFDAMGATISRAARRSHPTWGDQIGAGMAWLYSLFFVIGGLHSLGGLLRLWALNGWLGGIWLATVCLAVLGPILTRTQRPKA
jgi:hypothetical protein